MTSMREKIARSIYEKRNGHGCTPWRVQSGNHRTPYLLDADAVLDVLMEPTEGMLGAARADIAVDGPLGPKQSYRAMILAAKEGK